MKKKIIFKVVVLFAFVSLQLGCSDKKNEDNKDNNKTKIEASSKNTASELADAAEQLVSPYTFMLAMRIADMALEKDPENLKALFYKKLLSRFESFRGILVNSQSYERYKPEQIKNLQESIEKLPNSPLKDFLTKGGMPLRNVSDAQKIMDTYVDSLKDFRNFLKEHQGSSELVLNLNPYLFEEKIRDNLFSSCVVDDRGDSLAVQCDYKTMAQIRIGSADLIALSQITAGEILLLGGTYNSYSLDGIDQLVEKQDKLKQSGRSLTSQQQIEFLLMNKDFGKLRGNQVFALMRELTTDGIAAVKYALQMEKQLCPIGTESKNQRRGFLFSSGLCVEKTADFDLNMARIELALNHVVPVDFKNQFGSVVLNTNAFAWTDRPIVDLRSIAPTTYDKCGNPTKLLDNTVGGIFVDNNANLLLTTECLK